uniref:Si:dkey-83h2.3 n=1 Tax=Kryptolebias marmoratus TaxID=37003 RepID=A0A3Q2ZSQ1_KRYMA
PSLWFCPQSSSRYLRCVGVSLVPMAIVCMLCNILLLLPELDIHFLLEGHVTKEATWATGLWGSGELDLLLILVLVLALVLVPQMLCFCLQMLCQVLYSCVGLLAAFICFLVSGTGLVNGPLCQYNSPSGPTWGAPLGHSGYLYNRTMWSGVCMKPESVVQWNVVLFAVMGTISALQVLLCGLNVLNSMMGLILGQGSCQNKLSVCEVNLLC